MDNFNSMEEAENHFFNGGPGNEIRRNILGTLGTIRFLGSMADVYLNRMVDTVITMSGGSNKGPQGRNDDRSAGGRSMKDSGYPNQ